jgi:hypothetical protein
MLDKIPHYLRKIADQIPKTKAVLAEAAQYLSEVEAFIEKIKSIEYFQRYKNIIEFIETLLADARALNRDELESLRKGEEEL